MPLTPPPPPLRLSSRPALGLALALAAGIAGANAVGRGGLGTAVVAVAALAMGAYTVWTRRRLVTLRGLAAALAALASVAGLGALRLASVETLPPDHVAHAARPLPVGPDAVAPPPLTLWGRVATAPRRTASGIRFHLAADSAAGAAQRGTVRGRVEATLALPAEVRPGHRAPLYPALRIGDRVRLAGRLTPPPDRRNPAQMDYGTFLRRRGVHAALRVEAEADAAFLAPASRPADRLASAVQRHVRHALAQTVPDRPARAVLLALLLADRSEVEPDALDAFRETGLMHLLAVSGLHVLLVGLALYAFLKPVLGRLGVPRGAAEWSRTVLTLALLGVYALATGGSVSVVRALVMTAVVVIGRALQRRADALNALGVAALVLLLWRPTALFEVGFQLSFGAVAALVTLGPVLTGWLPAAWTCTATGRWATGSVVASTAATLGTAPALLVHFGQLPLAGLVLNALAIPLTGATLGAGLAAVATASGWPGLAALFGAFAEAAAHGLLWTSQGGATTLGWATLDGTLTNPWGVAALVVGTGALALASRPRMARRTALAAAALATVGIGTAAWHAAPRLNVVFLDVGQGDATLLAFPNGRHVLVDAGVRSPYGDEGARTVVPHLRRFGIGRLDALVLTHADADHIGGAASVLRAVPVGRLVVNGQAGETDLWGDLVRLADSLGVPLHATVAGDTLAVDPSVAVRVLGPSRGLARGGSANDASVVLHLQHGATRWLLTGDAEAAGEAALVARYGPLLAADVVKVGHHGSRTSSAPALVAAAGRPQVAVVSVARRNRYGLPNAEPLMRWQAAGAEVVQTATDGAVWLRSDGQAVTRVDWRD